MAEVPWVANPFRGDKFEAAWLPVAEAALDYGATGWALLPVQGGRAGLHPAGLLALQGRLRALLVLRGDRQRPARTIQGWYQVPIAARVPPHRRAWARWRRRPRASSRYRRTRRPARGLVSPAGCGSADAMCSCGVRAARARCCPVPHARLGRPGHAARRLPAERRARQRQRHGARCRSRFCDDGVPAAAGGATPNCDRRRARSRCRAAYAGTPGCRPRTAAAADRARRGHRAATVALDGDLSLPDPARHPDAAAAATRSW